MGKQHKKVIIAIPCQDTIKSRTTFSLVHASLNASLSLTCEIDMLLRMGCDLIGARNGLVKEAIARKGTHILFVDSDMYFPPDAIKKLVEQDRDIVGASYNFRSLPLKSTAFPLDKIDPVTADEPFKCEALGTGFLLIKLSVFDKIPAPWFQFARGADQEMVYGEDVWFCKQAVKAGYEIWADPTIGIKHCGEYLF